jgi:excisionase family DNA binding protein
MKRTSTPAKPTPARADEIMTVASLTRYLHCSQVTIYRLLKERKIPAFKLGSGPSSDWRFSRSAIDDWIATLYVITPPVTRGSGRAKRAAVNRKSASAGPRAMETAAGAWRVR